MDYNILVLLYDIYMCVCLSIYYIPKPHTHTLTGKQKPAGVEWTPGLHLCQDSWAEGLFCLCNSNGNQVSRGLFTKILHILGCWAMLRPLIILITRIGRWKHSMKGWGESANTFRVYLSRVFFFFTIFGVLCFQMTISSYHHHSQVESINISRCCHIFQWLCAWSDCSIIFCQILYISPKTFFCYFHYYCTVHNVYTHHKKTSIWYCKITQHY